VRLLPLPTLAVLALGAFLTLGPPLRAADDPVEATKHLVELATTQIEVGQDQGDDRRISEGLAKLQTAGGQLQKALAQPGLDESAKNRVRAWLVDVESRIDWWKNEEVRHPELFDDPEERPGGRRGPVVTVGDKK